VERGGTSFRLVPKDEIEMRPVERRFGKRKLATTLDFEIQLGTQTLAWAELKSGKRSIDEFTTFQLDQSDCDDITNVVSSSALPALVLHVQYERTFLPPSFEIQGKGVWWTDIRKMKAGFVKAERRRLESDKIAAHFSRTCFEPLETLPAALQGGLIPDLAVWLKDEGELRLYPPPPPKPPKTKVPKGQKRKKSPGPA
jgi:hypothetical protein